MAQASRRHGGATYAPSWSWVSVIGPITYQGLSSDDFPRNGSIWMNPCPLNKGETLWDERNDQSAFKVVDAEVERRPTSPFGPIDLTRLVLKGVWAEAVLQSEKKELPKKGSANGGFAGRQSVTAVGGEDQEVEGGHTEAAKRHARGALPHRVQPRSCAKAGQFKGRRALVPPYRHLLLLRGYQL